MRKFRSIISLFVHFFSEIEHSRSASLDDAIKAVRKNNNVALKGAIKEAETTDGDPEREDVNRALKKGLDLFASVSNIKVSILSRYFIFVNGLDSLQSSPTLPHGVHTASAVNLSYYLIIVVIKFFHAHFS